MTPRSKRARAPLSPLTVIGELLLLAGLGVLGYIVWQPWHAGTVVASNQVELSAKEVRKWTPEKASTEALPVPEVGGPGSVWGVMYIPALGDTWSYRLAETVNRPDPLDLWDKGVGHYETTPLPGQPGNFAVAAHRSGPLAPFRDLEYLRVGDPIFVETKDGWYTYTYRNSEVVRPDASEVLAAYPFQEDAQPGTSMITMTACHPKNGIDLRLIAFGVYESFTPRADGPPEALVKANPDVAKRAAEMKQG